MPEFKATISGRGLMDATRVRGVPIDPAFPLGGHSLHYDDITATLKYGPTRMRITQVSGNYTVLDSDQLVEVTSTASARTVTAPLPTAANKGQWWIVADGSDGAATHSITVSNTNGTVGTISANGGTLRFYSNGTALRVW